MPRRKNTHTHRRVEVPRVLPPDMNDWTEDEFHTDEAYYRLTAGFTEEQRCLRAMADIMMTEEMDNTKGGGTMEFTASVHKVCDQVTYLRIMLQNARSGATEPDASALRALGDTLMPEVLRKAMREGKTGYHDFVAAVQSVCDRIAALRHIQRSVKN